MLRHFYRCVVRLHPPGFRRRFGEEMLSIFEQASGRGLALRLLLDSVISLMRQWILRPEFWLETCARPNPTPAADGMPTFSTLDSFRPRTSAVINGIVLSVSLFCMTCFAIRYSWIRVLHVHIPEVEFEAQRWIPPSVNSNDFRGRPTEAASQDLALVANPITPPAALAPLSSAPTEPILLPNTARQRAAESAARANSKPRDGKHSVAGPGPRDAAGQPLAAGAPPVIAEDTSLGAAERHRVIEGVVGHLRRYYVDPQVADRMLDALRFHEKNGDDSTTSDGAALADLLTAQMRDVSHDPHVELLYSPVTTPENPPTTATEDVTRYRKEMQRLNCRFEKVEILPHNIGYLKLSSFPDTSICGPTAKAAMAKLNGVDAIIFDLRDNPGGYANMVALLATYLFDRRTHLNDFYDRGENSTEESWTLSPIPGNELADKPAFVLTSHMTFSAAEGFSYDLKMLKRAILVGETTSGRGHMGAEHRIDDHFTIRVPSVKVINPISGTNWEGRGVEPDVKVNAGDALKTAIRLAEATVQKR